MGIRSGFQKLAKALFNFRVDLWLDYKNLKAQTRFYYNQFRTLYKVEKNTQTETFEEAEKRLQLTSEFLDLQKKRYQIFIYFYLFSALLIFSYCFFIVFHYGNILGGCMAFAIAFYALTFAFRYHLWKYQIEKRKLGCSVKEWFFDLLETKVNTLSNTKFGTKFLLQKKGKIT